MDPFSGIFRTFDILKNPNELDEYRDTALTWKSEDKKIVVDTCVAYDTNEWETGISQESGEHFVIVEQYDNENEAKQGHEKWIKKMQKKPKKELEDINVWNI